MQDAVTIIVVKTTFPSEKVAQSITDTLITKHLAACAQIQAPISSIYLWNGSLTKEVEVPVSYKVSSEKEALFREKLLSLHPYEIPQYYTLEALATIEYGQWVQCS